MILNSNLYSVIMRTIPYKFNITNRTNKPYDMQNTKIKTVSFCMSLGFF